MVKKIADQIFKWYCHPDFYPDIKGDLEELYSDHLEEGRNAQFKYLIDVILLMRISLLRPLFKNTLLKDTGMFKNYFKISIRNLARHKMYSIINISGLAIGLSSFLLMYLYISFERSYDSFHKNSDEIYRASYVRVINKVDDDKDAMASRILSSTLVDGLPEVIMSTATKKFDEMIMKNGNVHFKESKVISADSNFLKIFNYPLIEGDKDQLFEKPRSVVLSQSRAKAYFGDSDPMGKTLVVTSPYSASLTVTGIIKDIPDNTHYQFDIMVSDKILSEGQDYDSWNWNNYYVYIKSFSGINKKELEDKINSLANAYINDVDDGESTENGTRIDLLNVSDIYLKSDFNYEPQIQGSEKAVTFLIIISIFILVIAWVNYVNLSTARALDRAKEVGLRKVIGAIRSQIIVQFLCEALLVNLLAGLIALVISEIALPYFNELVGKEMMNHVWNYPSFIVSLIVFAVGGAFLSGFYPAIVLSGYKPVSILKGKYRNSKSGSLLRKSLVVVQFASSLVLIAATCIIYLQINYMQTRDKGIDIDHVVTTAIPEPDVNTSEEYKAFEARFNSFKESLRNHTAIEAVGGTSNIPGGGADDINSTTTEMKLVGLTESIEGTTYIQYNDDEFFDVVDMSLLAGRNFDRDLKSDSSAIMINESLAVRLNQPSLEGLIGERIQFGKKERNQFTIVGVVKNFNRTSLKSAVEPTVYMPWMNAENLVIELRPDNYQDGIAHVKKVWHEYHPEAPFELTFLDQRFELLYDQDQRFGDTFLVFAIMAIFIAMLGLYGLASFMSIQRSKEVGVRKVLGASGKQILLLFYRDFIFLIGFAALISFPLVFLLMNDWLDNYSFRIQFPWVILLLALAVVLVFALATVGYQTLKVAKLDPAKTLKYE